MGNRNMDNQIEDSQFDKNSSMSIGPDGEKYPLPGRDDEQAEQIRLKQLVDEQRQNGRQIVVVMGIGFAGLVMSAVVADSIDKKSGSSGKFVIGMQRPSIRSFWKIPCLNKGISPVESEDPELKSLIKNCVIEKKTLIATYSYFALCLADVVIVDVQCDYNKNEFGNVQNGYADISDLENSFKIIGERIKPECLVIIETTVPPGTTEYIAYPIIKDAFDKRGYESNEPLLAHSFERVMPGRDYVSSVRDFWRVCSGINPVATRKVTEFLSEVINIKDYPLTILDRPIESETCKIIENSYRAAILAFLDEWSLFAERNGIDLNKLIEAIKLRPTHNNILFPGPGIGGYCLPKDGALGMWAYKYLLGFSDGIFKITPLAIDINDQRALHVTRLVSAGLREMGKITPSSKIAILGASYREDIGDTRYSGSEIIVRKLTEMGCRVKVHDPYVTHWWEFEKQKTYPAKGTSLKRFFQNQDDLEKLLPEHDLQSVLKGADAVILAVRHQDYLHLKPDELLSMAGQVLAVIDCFNLLSDDDIKYLLENGCSVKGLGRGHIDRIKTKAGIPDI